MSEAKPAVLAPPNPKLGTYCIPVAGPANQESREAHDHAREVRARRSGRLLDALLKVVDP